MSQTIKKVDNTSMKTVHLVLLCAMAGPLALLSTGCAATEGQHSNVSLQMPGTSAPPRVQNNNDQDLYQPPRDPQFNTALD
jgi:hypothetical protein